MSTSFVVTGTGLTPTQFFTKILPLAENIFALMALYKRQHHMLKSPIPLSTISGPRLGLIAIAILCFVTLCSCQETLGDRRGEHLDLGLIAAQKANQWRLTVETYGTPDRDDSTEHDVPRPIIVIRFLEYRAEMVKLVFVPDALVGEAPPYFRWKLFMAMDLSRNAFMPYAAASERLRRRLR